MSRPRMKENRAAAKANERIFEFGIGKKGSGGLVSFWHVGTRDDPPSDRLRIDLYRLDGPMEVLLPAENAYLSRERGYPINGAKVPELIQAAQMVAVADEGSMDMKTGIELLKRALQAVEVR